MSTRETRLFNLRRAIDAAGDVQALRAALGVTHQAIYHYKRIGYVPLARALDIERLYGVPARNLVSPKLLSAVDRIAASAN